MGKNGDFRGGCRDVWEMHSDDDPSAGAHPQDISTSQQSGDPQTGGLVLSNDLVAAAQHLM